MGWRLEGRFPLTRLFVAGIVLHFAALPVLALTPLADPRNTSGPVAAKMTTRAGSFTENQVRSWLESDCYTNVVGLMKDKDGIWHDKATKGTVRVPVGVDFKGNIVTQ